jgi:hypothetical protein
MFSLLLQLTAHTDGYNESNMSYTYMHDAYAHTCRLVEVITRWVMCV